MPTIAAHLAALEENLAAYRDMPGSHPGWKAVFLFYVAVQLVEAFCATIQIHHTDHARREDYVRSTHGHRVWAAYSRLRNESLKARYLAIGGEHDRFMAHIDRTTFSMTSQQVEDQLHAGAYAELRAYFMPKIKAAQQTAKAAVPKK